MGVVDRFRRGAGGGEEAKRSVAEGQTPVNMSVNMPRQMCRGHSVVAAVAVAAVRGAGIAARGIGLWWVLLRTHSDCVFVRPTVAATRRNRRMGSHAGRFVFNGAAQAIALVFFVMRSFSCRGGVANDEVGKRKVDITRACSKVNVGLSFPPVSAGSLSHLVRVPAEGQNHG